MDSIILSEVVNGPIPWAAWITLSVSLGLLVLSAFMSSSEVAFFSLGAADIEEVKRQECPADERLYNLLKSPEHLLATILIGNNLVNVAIVILTSYAFGLIFDFSLYPIVGFIIQTVVLTMLLLLFGEIIPKVYAQRAPLAFCRFSAPRMEVVHRLLSPMSSFLVRSTALVTKRMHKKKYGISVDDLSQAVDLLTDHKPEDKAMMEEIINFYSKTASEIMVPRIDMVDVEISWPFDRVLSFILESGYSRIPVYEESEDNIRGILYVKDLIPHKDKGADFRWEHLIRKAYFVPENKRLDDLLEEFRHNKIHMSIVVDEYGGTSGLVTLEDILEEIVGEISDEYDEEALPYKKLADGSYLFEAKTPLNDVLRYLELAPGTFGKSEEQVDTLGGLFMEIKQDLPKLNDMAEAEGWRFKVTQIERYRIIEILIIPPPSFGAEA